MTRKKTVASPIKKQLVTAIERHMIDNRLSQKQLNKNCGCRSASTVSRILSEKANCDVTIDKLLLYVTTLGYDVEIQIKKKHEN